jgi:hypothetical protein
MATHSAWKKSAEKNDRRFQVSSRSLQGHENAELHDHRCNEHLKVSPKSFNFNISEKTWTNKKVKQYIVRRIIFTARRDSVESRWAPFIILTRISFNSGVAETWSRSGESVSLLTHEERYKETDLEVAIHVEAHTTGS